MSSLHLRLYIILGIFFLIIYGIIAIIGEYLGIENIFYYFLSAFFLIFIQYMIGPKLVEWSMRVRYLERSEAPRLYQIVEELARNAGIPLPRIGISEISLPNAFAFGRTLKDGRVCVTRGILELLNEEELKAVLGHEISHLKNRDVLFITFLSVIPLVLYFIARYLMIFRGDRRRDSGAGVTLGLIALILYFFTNLLVLYISRIREYFADRGSIALGNKPEFLASALYKLVYGSARLPKSVLREGEGLKAFFLNDPSRAIQEIRDLSQLDLDRSGTIDSRELQELSTKKVSISLADRIMEILSTHPNMLNRIKAISEYRVW
jgi:heat shock protein HtpX